MDAKQLDRAAYIAAHAINVANLNAPQLATPGARQTHKIDAMADIIRGVFQAHDPFAELIYQEAEKEGCGTERNR